jgi:hypothetical protein
MTGYLVYVLLALLGLALVALPFLLARRGEKSARLFGAYVAGPMHMYLAKRGYRLTKRELILALVVVVLGLVVPIVTHFLESS